MSSHQPSSATHSWLKTLSGHSMSLLYYYYRKLQAIPRSAVHIFTNHNTAMLSRLLISTWATLFSAPSTHCFSTLLYMRTRRKHNLLKNGSLQSQEFKPNFPWHLTSLRLSHRSMSSIKNVQQLSRSQTSSTHNFNLRACRNCCCLFLGNGAQIFRR